MTYEMTAVLKKGSSKKRLRRNLTSGLLCGNYTTRFGGVSSACQVQLQTQLESPELFLRVPSCAAAATWRERDLPRLHFVGRLFFSPMYPRMEINDRFKLFLRFCLRSCLCCMGEEDGRGYRRGRVPCVLTLIIFKSNYDAD